MASDDKEIVWDDDFGKSVYDERDAYLKRLASRLDNLHAAKAAPSRDPLRAQLRRSLTHTARCLPQTASGCRRC